MEDEEKRIRDELSVSTLEISKENAFLFQNIDSFVTLSRENTIVDEVMLYPFDSDAWNYEVWDKVGEIVGNLMELQTLSIQFLPYFLEDDDDGDEAQPDWEILTRILPYVRHKVALRLIDTAGDDYAEVAVMQALARAIQGHPMISRFQSQDLFTYSDVALWCSILATLPSLESLLFGFHKPETEDQRDSIDPMPLKDLLRMPALRLVHFCDFHFTVALCNATANALEEGSSIVDITFDLDCSFPDGGIAVIADALKINASVTNVKFLGNFDGPLCNTLAAVLLCNSTLQNLTVYPRTPARGRWLSPIILSLGMNTTLKSLSVSIGDEFGDELCVAIRNGLAKNSTLEELILDNMIPSDDDGAVSARNALSFLRTNTTLKSLTVCFQSGQEDSLFGSAFRLEALKMMEDNPFLESLTIANGWDMDIKFEEFLAIVSALQHNTEDSCPLLSFPQESLFDR
jgi:hypothetical protein